MGEEMLVRMCMYTCDDDVSKDIKHEPPTDVKREKIDNAIKGMEDYRDGFAFIGKHDLGNVVDNCIRILKRHIGESE